MYHWSLQRRFDRTAWPRESIYRDLAKYRFVKGSRYRYYLAGTLLAALCTGVGLWLPLLRKLPVDYVDGQPLFTSEYTWGLDAGFNGTDLLLVALALVAVASVLATRRWRWPVNAVHVAVGSFTLFLAGQRLAGILRTERYAADPAIYLVIVGGLLFVVLGLVGAGLAWHRPLHERLSVR